jgi:cell division septum initiation protein DivIVA
MTLPGPECLPPFKQAWGRAYDRAEVDQFFTAISTKATSEIDEARFSIRWRGYDLRTVDEALDRWRAVAT